MPTTPRGIWTPADSDDWDLTVDLASMALSIDSAISASVATGSISMFGGSAAPAGFLICNGSAVSRTTYSALFSVVGTNFGGGDGSGTFNLPDLRGRVPVGIDATQAEFNPIGKTGGEKAHVLTVPEMPSHTHGQYVSVAGSGSGVRRDYTGDGAADAYPQGINTTATGGGGAHNNLQPYISLNFIIKF